MFLVQFLISPGLIPSLSWVVWEWDWNVKFNSPDTGPIRKIKPVSADIDHSGTTPAKQLQVRSLIKSVIVSIKCYRWAEPITFGGQLCDWEVAIQLTFYLDRSSLYFAVVESSKHCPCILTHSCTALRPACSPLGVNITECIKPRPMKQNYLNSL